MGVLIGFYSKALVWGEKIPTSSKMLVMLGENPRELIEGASLWG
jgi:hypothetical protein